MNRSVVRATALFVMASWAWMWLPQVSAQLVGQLIVTITSPANGATVSGTIPVNANVTIIGMLTVDSVQFKLDGANLGTEDSSAPYSIPWNTTTVGNGSHTLTAVARDHLGIQYTSNSVTVTVSNGPPPDTTPPTVSLTAPANGATVSGTITVSANASDNVGVAGVQFKLDGVNLNAEDTTSPYATSWNTTATSNGSHTLTAVARDAAGNSTTATAVTVTVSNDTTPPTVTINQATGQADPATTAPINFTAIFSESVSGFTGTDVTISGTAGGTKTVAVTGGPSTYNVAVSGMTSGGTVIATIGAGVVTDGAGNGNTASTSTDNTVTFAPPDTTPPTVSLTSPANGATVSGTINVTANASDNVGVAGVQFKLDGANLGAEDTSAPYAVSWDTTATSDGSHTLTAVARDAAGNSTTSAGITVTVSNGAPPDTTPPTVSLTAPANGATVSSTINVTATASDNVGVVGVQFQLDGVNLGAEDASAPYAVTWDTTTTSDGSHTLTAIARDAAGNSTTSAAVTVTVSNAPPPDTTPPTVSLTAPANGATVSGTITVSANASDNVGVAGVQFKLDGGNLSTEDTSAPYAVSWDTTTASNGSHTLTAVARDAAGNSTTAATITVTVSNGPPPTGGDVFFAFLDGRVEWRNPDGSLRQTLIGTSDGQASSLAFDVARNLYVPHWFSQSGKPGNFMERFDANGNLLGVFGSGYNCNPSSITFDAAGNVYVGQADCTGDILKFGPAGNLVASYDVLTTVRGTDHIDLASDGCTMFYSSRDKNIYRYDVCTNVQLPPFNTQPLPGDAAYHLRVLPDGGVLVADGFSVIVRLDAAGNQIQTYFVPGETNLWGGLDLVGDGTFWASNAWTDIAYRFDLQSGAILATINAGTGGLTLAGLGVRP